jgi:2-polyprenyl-3-methyl-5-hydroxy-6-metoxy-1,4-benzoquinol methylase
VAEDTKFSFGRNWKEFIEINFSEERVNVSKKHILSFLKLNDLQGKYILDIGCGSGLSSLAMFKSGIEKLVSFDLDPEAVQTTLKLKELSGNPSNWEVFQGSILDEQVINKIIPADIVYSWGVLHHTGKMWEAVENASKLIKPGGLFYLALYTTNSDSDHWLKVKKIYNSISEEEKVWMQHWYIVNYTTLPVRLSGGDPTPIIEQYKKNRGMDFFIDIKDWLGGYPFEHASIEEVKAFVKNKLKLELINIKTGEANTEYLFRKN